MLHDREALVVGVNYYRTIGNLYGCVEDAKAVTELLRHHGDTRKSRNFYVTEVLAESQASALTLEELKDSVRALFFTKCRVALFYFAGHGFVESAGGYILHSTASRGDQGLSLRDLMDCVNDPRVEATSRIVILDSCHSGAIASEPFNPAFAEIKDGTTILTATTDRQEAIEANGHGIFTSLLLDGLRGAAANILGDISVGSIYAHIDQALPPKAQRPVFKTNVSQFVSLRSVEPQVQLEDLRNISKWFTEQSFYYKLDPSYEPERNGSEPPGTPAPDPAKNEIFRALQSFNRAGLLVPKNAPKPHMWHAAMFSAGCVLTSLGEYYRRLAKAEML